MAVWSCGGGVLGEESAAVEHACGGVAMGGGVEGVEPVGEYAYGGQLVVEGCAVCVDVGAVGESADDEEVGIPACELCADGLHHVASLVGAAACADNAEYMGGVEFSVAPIVEGEGCIGTYFAQSGGVAWAVEGEDADAVVGCELGFGLRLGDVLGEQGGVDAEDVEVDVGGYLMETVGMLNDGRGAACPLVELAQLLASAAEHHGEGHAADLFAGGHRKVEKW